MGNKCPVPSGYVCDTGMKSKEAAEAETHTDMRKIKSGLGSGSSPGAVWAGQVVPPKSTRCLRAGLKPCTSPAPWKEGIDRGAKAGTQWKCRSTGWRAAPLAQGDAGDTCLPHEVTVQAAERFPSPGMLCPCRYCCA